MPVPPDVAALLAERFGVPAAPEEGAEIQRDQLLDFARSLRALGFDYFVYCAAAHYPAADALPDRVLVAYRVRRLPNDDVPFCVWVPTGETTPSLVTVWRGADWQEREQYDLVGPVFADHPDLRRLMLPEDWEGHPLRRDYAIDTRHHPWR